VGVLLPVKSGINTIGLFLLILGGLFYTIGGIIYSAEPEFFQFKSLGFHEIFHTFILFGSLAHFLSMLLYVI
jgi:hemolysin III